MRATLSILATAPGTPHQVRCLFANHDNRRICIARRYFRYDRCIHNTQTTDTVHTQLMIDNGQRVVQWAHFARASLMVFRSGIMPYSTFPIFIRAEYQTLAAGHRFCVQLHAVRFERFGLREPNGEFDALGQYTDIVVFVIAQVVGYDFRRNQRVVRLERNVAAALRMQHRREDLHRSRAVRLQLTNLAGFRATGQKSAKVELQIGHIRAVRVRARDFRCNIRNAGAGHQAVAEQQILHGGRPVQRRRIRIVDEEIGKVRNVIVQIFAHTR